MCKHLDRRSAFARTGGAINPEGLLILRERCSQIAALLLHVTLVAQDLRSFRALCGAGHLMCRPSVVKRLHCFVERAALEVQLAHVGIQIRSIEAHSQALGLVDGHGSFVPLRSLGDLALLPLDLAELLLRESGVQRLSGAAFLEQHAGPLQVFRRGRHVASGGAHSPDAPQHAGDLWPSGDVVRMEDAQALSVLFLCLCQVPTSPVKVAHVAKNICRRH
mmetsp:Transcript_69547/g.201494  ORF Transcript_69547/g.201494 Transcript_69547/m.201494 type:complete len:220 (-) Transcript_69547:704-1363(-)